MLPDPPLPWRLVLCSATPTLPEVALHGPPLPVPGPGAAIAACPPASGMTDESLAGARPLMASLPSGATYGDGNAWCRPRRLRAILIALEAEEDTPPPQAAGLIVVRAGEPIVLPGAAAGPARLQREEGGGEDLRLEEAPGGAIAPPVGGIGYHAIEAGGQRYLLAVCPPRCLLPAEVCPGRRPWGWRCRQPPCPGRGERGFRRRGGHRPAAGSARGGCVGDQPGACRLRCLAAALSPYSPSSRLAINPLHAALPGPPTPFPTQPLIRWEEAGPAKWAALRSAFAAMGEAERAAFAAFRAAGGEALARFALFEALHATFTAQGLAGLGGAGPPPSRPGKRRLHGLRRPPRRGGSLPRLCPVPRAEHSPAEAQAAARARAGWRSG